jgi:hypothetical protein
MNKRASKAAEPDLRPEYDFSGVQGKYARRYAQGTNVVVLEPDVAKAFPSAAAVNNSLGALAALVRQQRKVLAAKKPIGPPRNGLRLPGHLGGRGDRGRGPEEIPSHRRLGRGKCGRWPALSSSPPVRFTLVAALRKGLEQKKCGSFIIFCVNASAMRFTADLGEFISILAALDAGRDVT